MESRRAECDGDITITNVNDAPVALDDAYTMAEDTC